MLLIVAITTEIAIIKLIVLRYRCIPLICFAVVCLYCVHFAIVAHITGDAQQPR